MRLVQGIIFLLAFGPVFEGCGSRGGGANTRAPAPAAAASTESGATPADSVQPPARLTYAADPAVYIKDQPIAPNSPYLTGGLAASFRASPPLPKGLAIDPATGVISGTPTAVTAAGTYQVTAANRAGSASLSLTITVNAPAPTAAPVVTLPPFATAGKTGLAASIPDQGAGASYTWNLTGGSLVSGQGTPAITFSAGTSGTVDLAVTVLTSGGSITGKASAAIVPAPEATLTFPMAVRPGQGGFQASVQGRPGMKYIWTIVPGSSSASITSGQGTQVVGLSAGTAPGTFEIQVLVENAAGDRAMATGTVKVHA